MLEAARQLHERNLGGIAALESRLSFRLAVLQRMLDREQDDLLALYERWRREANTHDARRLIRAGVLLDPASADILH